MSAVIATADILASLMDVGPSATTGPRPTDVETHSIGTAAALGAVASVAGAAFSIARSKVTAIILGPVGIGMTSEILQITTLFTAPAAMFSGPAFVAAVSRARADADRAAVTRLYLGAFSGAFILSSVGGVAAILASRFLLPEPWGAAAWPLVLLSAVGGVVATLANVPGQQMVGCALLRTLTVASLASSAVQALLVALGTVAFGLTGQFVAITVGHAATLAIAVALGARSSPDLTWRPRWRFDRPFAVEAAKLGGTALVASVGLQGALVFIRWTLDRAGGPEANGQFQAAWMIGNVYFGLVLTALANYSFPRYAAARDATELRAELDTAGRFVLRVAPPLVLIVIAARVALVRALYSARFDPSVDLMGLMMVGDLAKAIVWVQQGALLARSRLREYLIVELTMIALLTTGTAFLVPRFGLEGVGLAYVGAYILSAAVAAVPLRMASGVSLGLRAYAFTAATTALLAAAAWFSSRACAGRWVVAAVGVGWLIASGLLRDAFLHVRSMAARRPASSRMR